jgi:hypothetical protein
VDFARWEFEATLVRMALKSRWRMMLGHTTTAVTADLCAHVLADIKAQAVDRLDAIFESAEKQSVIGPKKGAWVDRKTDYEQRPTSAATQNVPPVSG